jgi:hypothetical protein
MWNNGKEQVRSLILRSSIPVGKMLWLSGIVDTVI